MKVYKEPDVYSKVKNECLNKACLVNIFDGSKYLVNSDVHFRIGRDADMELTIIEKIISRKHAVISCEEIGFCLIDLGSKNGTFINGSKIESNKKYKLENLDVIEFSKIKYRFEIDFDKDEKLIIDGIEANFVNIYGKKKLCIEIDENQEIIYYQSRMIKENNIDGLLNMITIDNEDKSRIYFDIEEMESFAHRIKRQGPLTKTNFITLLHYLLDTCKKAEEYLLVSNSFLLDPRIIYFEREQKKPYLVYLPLKNLNSYLERLKGFIINLDRGYLDSSAEELQIRILKALSNENFSVKQLRHMIMEEENITLNDRDLLILDGEKRCDTKEKTNINNMQEWLLRITGKSIFLVFQVILLLLLAIIMFSEIFSISQCIGLFIIIIFIDFWVYYKNFYKCVKNEK